MALREAAIPLQLGRRALGRGQSRRLHLQPQPDLDDRDDVLKSGHVLRIDLQGPPPRIAGDEHAGAVAHDDETVPLQQRDRFPHDRPADAEAKRHLLHRRQPAARLPARRSGSDGRCAPPIPPSMLRWVRSGATSRGLVLARRWVILVYSLLWGRSPFMHALRPVRVCVFGPVLCVPPVLHGLQHAHGRKRARTRDHRIAVLGSRRRGNRRGRRWRNPPARSAAAGCPCSSSRCRRRHRADSSPGRSE